MQGFNYLTNPFLGANATQTFSKGVTTLDTTENVTDSAGYFARSSRVPKLDRQQGYTLQFTVQILRESHAAGDRNRDGISDRAGFSVILLGDDMKGIELGFWTNQVWAQQDGKAQPPPSTNTLFTHAESANFNTTTGLITYELTLKGNNYTLSSGGKTILTNRLRDYSVFGFPYDQPNFIFLGDNTGSASAQIRLASVVLKVSSGV
jgi:hypothetical protein